MSGRSSTPTRSRSSVTTPRKGGASCPARRPGGVASGSRGMVTEGARVGRGSLLGAGVILNPSIPVIDAETGAEVSRGVVPPWSLVVQATRPREFPGGIFGLACALIIRRLTEGERHDKAKLNDILRTHGVTA